MTLAFNHDLKIDRNHRQDQGIDPTKIEENWIKSLQVMPWKLKEENFQQITFVT